MMTGFLGLDEINFPNLHNHNLFVFVVKAGTHSFE